jgi:hypothetical protein
VRSLAVKIFLSFWIMHALILVVLALLPDQGARARLGEIARRDGRIATTLLEHTDGSRATLPVGDATAADVQIAILDARGAVAARRRHRRPVTIRRAPRAAGWGCRRGV